MFIFKNAIRCILRSKGRNVLLGIISLVIAVSACLGLSIRQAAESAKAETLAGMSVTATISFDRQSMMGNMGRPDSGGFDKEQFEEMMGGASSLTLEEYETYAQADSVQDFYYTLTVSVNSSDSFSPVTTESEDSGSSAGTSFGGGNFGGGFGGFGGGMPGMSGGGREDMSKNPFTNYITEVNSAMNLTVVVQMLGIGLLLTLIAGAVSILFIMRYNPLKILSNRD